MRRVVFFAVALLAISGIAIVAFQGWRSRQRVIRRLAIWEAEQREDAFPPALEQTYEWQHAELTLADFAKLAADKSGLEVVIDEANLGAARLRRLNDAAIGIVRVPEGSYQLDTLLSLALGPLGLHAEPQDGKLYITTQAGRAASAPRTAVFPVPLRQPHGLSDEDWANLIGGNARGEVFAVPGAVVIHATAREQRRARQVIAAVQNLAAAKPDVARTPLPSVTTAELELERALERSAELDVVEMALKDVTLYLTEQYGVPLILYAPTIEDANISLDTPITKSLRGVSLRSLLRLVLKDLELTYVSRDGALFITTPEDAESREVTIAYALSDFQPELSPGERQELRDLIQACIGPDSWWGDGSGKIPVTEHGWLICRQTSEVHEQVAALLATLRKCAKRADHFGSVAALENDEKEAQIRAALQQPITLNAQRLPIKDVVLYFQEALSIPIVLSAKKMEEASVSQDTPVTIKLPRAAGVEQLEAVLQQVKLDFVIRDEILQITTREDAESHLDLRIYDARHLAPDVRASQELCADIREAVMPQVWDTAGGPASLHAFRGMLIVAHMRRGHEALERFLKSKAGATMRAFSRSEEVAK